MTKKMTHTFWKIDNEDLLDLYEKASRVQEISPQFILLIQNELQRRKLDQK
ncbi:sporulation histidine kinase inhibitor Sda [Halalkalibacter sp. APA_J-10(15)]|uniref:sporulation histidine kinase inhibitor Sda n=1 Tax=Halalkalibacter sp. APA_J-10(15) TaxID=2933805 RepID=UPI001FF1A7BB|nr:sporulation histidine kinase inhibitor Sda [Halalkalibacter sp. APA_J-10(15)]MCK0473105.1 sporulation histidine kinase inhibitor Sda [Halalkalibacter sp. APA_J-10(15)]